MTDTSPIPTHRIQTTSSWRYTRPASPLPCAEMPTENYGLEESYNAPNSLMSPLPCAENTIYVDAADRYWRGGEARPHGPAPNLCKILRALKSSKGPIIGQAALSRAACLPEETAAARAYSDLASWWPDCFAKRGKGQRGATYQIAAGYRIEIVKTF